MSLPLPAIDRLFTRLNGTYGRDFMAQFEGMETNAVKTIWAHELASFAKNLDALAWALEQLPERAPNVIVFKNLCCKAPVTEAPMLPSPKVDPVIAGMAIEAVRKTIANSPNAYRGDWAFAILAREKAGEKISPTVITMAKDGLANLGLSSAIQ